MHVEVAIRGRAGEGLGGVIPHDVVEELADGRLAVEVDLEMHLELDTGAAGGGPRSANLWAMGDGLWAMGHGLRAMGHGLWAMCMGYGLWAMGYGLWAMGYGQWAMG